MFTQPNFFFIGGMRCGSTSLNLMLEQHPEIYMSQIKEPYYYLAQAYRNKDNPTQEDLEFLAKFEKGGKYRMNETYQSLFQDVGGAKIVGESSHYLYRGETAIAISRDCPNARILVSLRDPVERLFSEYLLFLRTGRENGTFGEFVNRHATDFIDNKVRDKIYVPKLNKGLQAAWLELWFEQFSSEQVKVVFFDDLNLHPADTMKNIFTWLEIDDGFVAKEVHAQKGGAVKAKWFTTAMNSQNKISRQIKSRLPKSTKIKLRSAIFSKTLERPEMEEQTRAFLTEFYQEDVDALSKMFDRDLSNWMFS